MRRSMVYIYKKVIGDKEYYYLRASVRKDGKIVVKDIKYLGNDLHSIRAGLANLPSTYAAEIRKAYKTINRFLEANTYLEKAKALKLKKNEYLSTASLEGLEACRIHWRDAFLKLDELTREEVLKDFLIEFAYNTTSLEGNTITLEQARNLLAENQTPKNKSLREVYDLQNTERVFFTLFRDASRELTHELICEVHDALLENIDTRTGYRTTDVRVFKASFKSTPAPYVAEDMDALLRWYRAHERTLHPFVLATAFHHKLEKIHPFMDGNGRTGRMLLNHILLSHGHPPLIIRKKNRLLYLEKLHAADASPLLEVKPERYAALVEFDAREQTGNYWNLFL